LPHQPVLTDTTTQEPIVHVETVPQEPVLIDIVVPQEPVLTDTIVTQEPATQHVKDVPLAQLFAQIEQNIKNTKNSRITALITENDNLKVELNTLKQEVEAA
jgi:hypothetical protein